MKESSVFMMNQDQTPAQPTNYVQSYQPPQDTQAPSAAEPDAEVSEMLEEQNIFDLLGVQDGTEEEREVFLDELQQVIWEDFIENDVPLLVTADEMKQVDDILGNDKLNDIEKQEQLIDYLQTTIPDLEDIMMEKALELKEEMVKERLTGLREMHATNPEILKKIDEAETLYTQNKWKQGTALLNSLT